MSKTACPDNASVHFPNVGKQMLSRKQFLNKLLIHACCVLTSFVNAPEKCETYGDKIFLASTELSPALLNMEAERLGIDPAKTDEEYLRSKVYESLRQECCRQFDSSA